MFYSETPEKMSGTFDASKCDAVKQFLKHFDNSLVILFLMSNGTVHEKATMRRQMEICERKMLYWKRQDNFCMKRALIGTDAAKKKWTGGLKSSPPR